VRRDEWSSNYKCCREAGRGTRLPLLESAKRAYDRLAAMDVPAHAQARRSLSAAVCHNRNKPDAAGNEEKEPDERYLWNRALSAIARSARLRHDVVRNAASFHSSNGRATAAVRVPSGSGGGGLRLIRAKGVEEFAPGAPGHPPACYGRFGSANRCSTWHVRGLRVRGDGSHLPNSTR